MLENMVYVKFSKRSNSLHLEKTEIPCNYYLNTNSPVFISKTYREIQLSRCDWEEMLRRGLVDKWV